MWWIIFSGLLFYGLIQVTTWTLPYFRQGIVVFKYSGPFLNRVPEKFVNRKIELGGVTFMFVSRTNGFFRCRWRPKRRSTPRLLLGEVVLTDEGVARIVVRISFSAILILIAICIGFINLAIQGTYSVNSLILGVLLINIFCLFDILAEKDILLFGLEMMKKYFDSIGGESN